MKTLDLPTFPWDLLEPYKKQAQAFEGGFVDLSVGTPVDPTPPVAQQALAEAADAHGYPTVLGTVETRQAIVDWFARERGVNSLDTNCVFPTVGSKELVANLGWQLGLEPGDKVLIPKVAYPTYDICARVAGAEPVAVGEDPEEWPEDAALVWLNTPGNPNGHVLDTALLRKVVAWARRCGAVVVSDECYATLDWQGEDSATASPGVPSLLSDEVCDGDLRGLLVTYSLSKESNLAGYRAAFLGGDPELIDRVVQIRKHCGFMVPTPVQAALRACLGSREHVSVQREIYARRRQLLKDAVLSAGLVLDSESVAGLYLWGYVPGRSCWDLVAAFARIGVLVAPGEFYGSDSGEYVRIALTGNDDDVEKVSRHLNKFGLIFND